MAVAVSFGLYAQHGMVSSRILARTWEEGGHTGHGQVLMQTRDGGRSVAGGKREGSVAFLWFRSLRALINQQRKHIWTAVMPGDIKVKVSLLDLLQIQCRIKHSFLIVQRSSHILSKGIDDGTASPTHHLRLILQLVITGQISGIHLLRDVLIGESTKQRPSQAICLMVACQLSR